MNRPGFCVWVDLPAGGVQCSVCGVVRKIRSTRKCDVPAPASPPLLRRSREALGCGHRGAEVRRQPIVCCGGKSGVIVVFGCARHGECQIGTALQRVTSCRRCPDFV